ncbi:MAG: hypothetical protein LRY40_03675, partial [Shewanella fodinae]|nr:hypothetical protein [Shewanella fodinae]
ATAPRSARESSGRCDRYHRLNVLYFPFSETTLYKNHPPLSPLSLFPADIAQIFTEGFKYQE